MHVQTQVRAAGSYLYFSSRHTGLQQTFVAGVVSTYSSRARTPDIKFQLQMLKRIARACPNPGPRSGHLPILLLPPHRSSTPPRMVLLALVEALGMANAPRYVEHTLVPFFHACGVLAQGSSSHIPHGMPLDDPQQTLDNPGGAWTSTWEAPLKNTRRPSLREARGWFEAGPRGTLRALQESAGRSHF